MADAHKNFAISTVAVAPSPASSGTTLSLPSGDGAKFPATPFNATIWPSGALPLSTNAEIVRVTSIVADALTFTRTQEGTSARSILVGDQIAATITAKTLTDVETVAAAALVLGAAALTNINVSAGATSNNLSALTFSNGGGVSFGLNGSIVTATVATNYQPAGAYLTTAALSQDSSKYAGTNGAITGGSITVNTGGVSVNLPAYLTTAMQSNAATISNVNVSAGTTSNNLSAITFSNSNGVSFGLNGSVITGTVATNYQSPGAYLTTADLSQNSSKYAGTAGAITGGSITVNTSGVSVNLPAYITTAMQSNAATISNINISAGATSNNLSALTFSNLNGVTFGLTGSTLTASVAAVGGAQTGISGIIVSDATYTSGTVSFSNAGNITISSSVNGATQFIRLSGHASQTNQSAIKGFGVSNTGQTAGNTGISTGIDWVLAGSGSITLSQSTAGGGPNTVWVQHPAWITTAMQSGAATISNINVSAGATSNNLSAITFSNINGVSFGLTGSTLTASVAAAGGAQTAISGIVVSDTTYTSGTVSFSGNNITIASSVNGATQYIKLSGNAAQTNQSAIKAFGVSNTGQTAGNTGVSTGVDWVLAGSGSITLSQSTAGGGPNTVWLQHPAWLTTARASNDAIGLNTAQSNVTWTVNSSGFSLDARGYVGSGFTSAGNNIGLSATNNSAGLSLSATVAAQSVQTVGIYATGGNTIGQSSSSTFDARSLNVSGMGNISAGWSGSTLQISGGSNNPVNISAGTTSSNLGTIVFSNSNQITFGLSGSTITASANTVGTATSGYPVGSANSIGTITRWVAEDHVHAGIGAIGISTGNTTGTSGSVQGTYWFAGSGDVSVSQITSNNGSHTLIINKRQETLGFFEPYSQTNTAGLALVAGSWYFAPFMAPQQIGGGRINFLHVNTATAGIVRDITGGSYVSSSSGGKNQSYTYSKAVALYSQGTGTNSTRLESFWSNSFSFGLSHRVLISQSGANSSVSVTVSQSISYISEIGSDGAYTLNQFASNNNSAGTNTSIASNNLDSVGVSIRNMLSNSLVVPVGFNTTITAGAYWLAVAWSSTSASATSQTSFAGASALMFSELSQVGISHLELGSLFRNWGSTVTTARSGLMPYGVYTGGANMAPPQFVNLSSDLSSLASQWSPYFNFQMRGLTQ